MVPLPIVLCGKAANIAASAQENLRPEYEVIHMILTLSSGITDIPLLLSSQSLPPNSIKENAGSQNYTKVPVAVALGGGYNDEMFAQIKDACKDAPGTVWLRADISRMKEMPKPEEMAKYGKESAERLKKKLDELKVGQEGGVKEGVFWF